MPETSPPSPSARTGRATGWFLLGALPFALIAGFAVRLAGRATDDMYITYRYAQNLAAGRGLVFNPGERIFGVTDPGIALILAAAHRVTTWPIPLLGTWLHAISIATVAGLLLYAARRHHRQTEAIAAGVLLATSSVFWAAQGSGPPVAVALLLLAALALERHPSRAGALAGFAAICRPDALVGVAILGAMAVLKSFRDGDPDGSIDVGAELASSREGQGPPLGARTSRAGTSPAPTPEARLRRKSQGIPWAYALAAAAVVALGALAARVWFGTWIPNTLAAKRAYATLDPERWRGGFEFWNRGYELLASSAGPLTPGLVALGIVGLPFLWRSAGRPGRLLALYGAALALIYPLLGVPFFVWYAAPPLIALLSAAPFAIGAAVRRIERRGFTLVSSNSKDDRWEARTDAARASTRSWLAAVVLLGLALPLVGSLAGGFRAARNPGAGDWRFPAYSQAGAWIAAHSTPEEDTAYEEIGILAFTADRPVQDLVGLVTPRSLPFAHDRLGAFLAKPTTFVVFHTYNARGGTRPIVDRPWFLKAYREVTRFPSSLPGFEGRHLAIYRRIPGAPVPPPRPPRKR